MRELDVNRILVQMGITALEGKQLQTKQLVSTIDPASLSKRRLKDSELVRLLSEAATEQPVLIS